MTIISVLVTLSLVVCTFRPCNECIVVKILSRVYYDKIILTVKNIFYYLMYTQTSIHACMLSNERVIVICGVHVKE